MDFQKAKIYIDKLQREFARMSKDPENTVRLDVDIMASYVRELYDAILSDQHTYVAPQVTKAAPPPPPPPPPPPVVVVEPTPPPPPPVVVPEPPAPPPVVIVEPTPPPPPPVVEEAPKPAPRPPAVTGTSAAGWDVLFEEKQAKELSEKLAESPIADLKKAIALNDRLQYTSELFAGDGKAFEAALAALNGFSGFEEARQYLIDNFVAYYTWTDKKRLETAKTFVKLVRRRYK